MKKPLIYIVMMFFVLIISSCEDDRDKKILTNDNAIASTLLTPLNGSSFQLESSEGESSFEIFTWSAAEYGVSLSTEYILQCDIAGNNFEKAFELTSTSDLFYEHTNEAINLKMYDEGLQPNAPKNVYFRVLAIVKNNAVDTLYSNTNEVSITTYSYSKPNYISLSEGENVLLFEKDADIVFDPVTWEEVKYGSAFSTTYTIEFDDAGNGFAEVKKLASGLTEPKYVTTIGALNEVFLKAGLNADLPNAIETRVVASAGSGSGIVYGDPLGLMIYPYTVDDGSGETRPSLYLMGSATSIGWNNVGIEVAWDKNDNIYSIITEFTAGGIKVLEVSGQWAPQWGDDGTFSGKLSYRPDEATTDPPEIPSPGTGLFKMIIDIDNLTYMFEAM